MQTDASSTTDPAPTLRRLWLYRVTAATSAILLSLAVGEIVVRSFNIGPGVYPLLYGTYTLSDNPRLLYELAPGGVSPEDGLPTNADGMRDRDYPIPKPPYTFRIACVGDSICFGAYVKQSETFPKQLEDLLNRRVASDRRRFEVLNFGLTGYNIAQVMETVRVRVLKYQPDLILYAYCLNDPEDFNFQYAALRAQLTAADKHYRDALVDRGNRLAMRSRLWILARHTLESTTDEGLKLHLDRPADSWLTQRRDHLTQWTIDLHRGKSWDRTVRQFDNLAAIAHTNNIDMQIVIFPFFTDMSHYPYREAHDRIAVVSRERSLGVIDLLEDFQALARESDKPFNVDVAHPNARGHAFASVAICRQLIQRGLIPARVEALADLGEAPDPINEFARLLSIQPP